MSGQQTWLRAAVADPRHGGVPQGFKHDVVKAYGPLVKTAKIVPVAEYTGAQANAEVEAGLIEAAAFGTWFIYNPDLYHRIQEDLPIDKVGYLRGHYQIIDGDVRKSYSDYPFAEAKARVKVNGTVESK